MNRRRFLQLSPFALSLTLGACASTGRAPVTAGKPVSRVPPDIALAYSAQPQEQFPLPGIDMSKVDPQFYRQIVRYPSAEQPGTVVVDPHGHFLYLVLENGRALRYGVGVGRQGFSWNGDALIKYKKAWPTWTPPSEMIERQPELEEFRTGMAPGLSNPLGARALYLFDNGVDTLYRIHGTNEPWSIGKSVSSGCIRMFNQDIIDLYNRVPDETKVVVV
ncbi:MAG: L,D-transpeptidase [Stappiaceae bacterium]